MDSSENPILCWVMFLFRAMESLVDQQEFDGSSTAAGSGWDNNCANRLPKAGATKKRRPHAVGCSAWIRHCYRGGLRFGLPSPISCLFSFTTVTLEGALMSMFSRA